MNYKEMYSKAKRERDFYIIKYEQTKILVDSLRFQNRLLMSVALILAILILTGILLDVLQKGV